MHPTLLRQVKKIFGSEEKIPENLKEFISTVQDTYDGFDDDRELVERSLELSSKELSAINAKLSKENKEIEAAVKDRTLELEQKINSLEKYENITTDRELKMIELKKEVNSLLKELNREPKYKELDTDISLPTLL